MPDNIGKLEDDIKGLDYCTVVTDSASDIPIEYSRSNGINVVPLYIIYNGREFRDGIDIRSEKIYTLQKEKGAIFTSSTPSPKDFTDLYNELLDKYQNIISIHISSRLSAVIKSARIAADLLKAEKQITVYDSLSGTMGTGFMAIAASKAIKKGLSIDEVLDILGFLKDNIMLYGTIDTLKYLRLSGRVPAAARLATAVFRIKPLLGIKNGVVEMIGLTVTRWGSINEITRRAIKRFKKEKWVVVSVIHSLSKIEAEKVMGRLKESLNCVEALIVDCTPVVGAHTGPGLIGIIISRLDKRTAEVFI